MKLKIKPPLVQSRTPPEFVGSQLLRIELYTNTSTLTVYASSGNETLSQVAGPTPNDPKATSGNGQGDPLPDPKDPIDQRGDVAHKGIQEPIKQEHVSFSNRWVDRTALEARLYKTRIRRLATCQKCDFILNHERSESQRGGSGRETRATSTTAIRHDCLNSKSCCIPPWKARRALEKTICSIFLPLHEAGRKLQHQLVEAQKDHKVFTLRATEFSVKERQSSLSIRPPLPALSAADSRNRRLAESSPRSGTHSSTLVFLCGEELLPDWAAWRAEGPANQLAAVPNAPDRFFKRR
ncbi:hypothetical protein PCANC_04107 [Puccinia coronata f. sp. avenae]|uniref:Glycoside hydrolase 131 catalytic N-terminal domain-containing protein n=1 Tax=Puccinia coronata f. sp. avenae TaxID=200324 RepID=A0A2N5W7D0_9BASI|nr:hypothetical protein PCANC_04107 [Puccinia coronata f. sp. avenae]